MKEAHPTRDITIDNERQKNSPWLLQLQKMI